MSNHPIRDSVFDEVASNKALEGKSSQYLASLRYNLRKALKHQCRYGGCKTEVSGYLCHKHKTRVYANYKAWEQRRKNNVINKAKERGL